MAKSADWSPLFQELRRRKVFRVATLYVVLFWPLIQIADILQPTFEFSDVVLRIMLYCFIGGFPIALALSWLYDLNQDGVVRDAAGTAGSDTHEPMIHRTVEGVVIGLLLLLVVALFVLKATLFDEPAAQQTAVQKQAAAPTARIPAVAESIAVLPFTSFSSHNDDAVFADGLTEELLNVLSRCQNLRVAARTSSFAYKGVKGNIQKVGRELGVAKVLEGSVRRNDVNDNIRITAQLIDVESGVHLWSQTYDREYRDIFKIQDEIAAAVAEKLSMTMLGASSVSGKNTNPEAFIALSRGREEMAKRTPASLHSAVGYFENAVRIDPTSADAYTGLADTSVLLVMYAGADHSYLERAQKAVDEALRLDPGLGAAWASQGLIFMQSEESRKQSIEALEKAISLNPSYAIAYMWLGTQQNEPAKTLEYHQKALDLDPRSAIAAYNVAHDWLEAGDEDKAMHFFSQIIAADPFFPGAYKLVAHINQRHGRIGDAILEYRRAYELESDGESALALAQLYATLGDNDQASTWLETARSKGITQFKTMDLWIEVMIHFSKGETEKMRNTLHVIAKHDDTSLFGNLSSTMAYTTLGNYATAVENFAKASRAAEQSGLEIGFGGFFDPFLFGAHAYQQVDRDSDADKLLQQIQHQIDARLKSPGHADPGLWYSRAEVYAMQNDPGMAINTLERAIDEGWTEKWRLMLDPMMKPLLGNERVKLMIRGLDTRLAIMREELAREMERS